MVYMYELMYLCLYLFAISEKISLKFTILFSKIQWLKKENSVKNSQIKKSWQNDSYSTVNNRFNNNKVLIILIVTKVMSKIVLYSVSFSNVSFYNKSLLNFIQTHNSLRKHLLK